MTIFRSRRRGRDEDPRTTHVVVGSAAGMARFPVATRGRIAAWRDRAGLDARLAAGEPPESSVPLAIRADRLVRPRACRTLAGTLDWIASQARAPVTLRATPINGRTVRGAERELAAVAARLRERGPITARGVALVRTLVTDGDGPLYTPHSSVELRTRLDRAAAALDPRSAVSS